VSSCGTPEKVSLAYTHGDSEASTYTKLVVIATSTMSIRRARSQPVGIVIVIIGRIDMTSRSAVRAPILKSTHQPCFMLPLAALARDSRYYRRYRQTRRIRHSHLSAQSHLGRGSWSEALRIHRPSQPFVRIHHRRRRRNR
jgi:hypothetical protein